MNGRTDLEKRFGKEMHGSEICQGDVFGAHGAWKGLQIIGSLMRKFEQTAEAINMRAAGHSGTNGSVQAYCTRVGLLRVQLNVRNVRPYDWRVCIHHEIFVIATFCAKNQLVVGLNEQFLFSHCCLRRLIRLTTFCYFFSCLSVFYIHHMRY